MKHSTEDSNGGSNSGRGAMPKLHWRQLLQPPNPQSRAPSPEQALPTASAAAELPAAPMQNDHAGPSRGLQGGASSGIHFKSGLRFGLLSGTDFTPAAKTSESSYGLADDLAEIMEDDPHPVLRGILEQNPKSPPPDALNQLLQEADGSRAGSPHLDQLLQEADAGTRVDAHSDVAGAPDTRAEPDLTADDGGSSAAGNAGGARGDQLGRMHNYMDFGHVAPAAAPAPVQTARATVDGGAFVQHAQTNSALHGPPFRAKDLRSVPRAWTELLAYSTATYPILAQTAQDECSEEAHKVEGESCASRVDAALTKLRVSKSQSSDSRTDAEDSEYLTEFYYKGQVFILQETLRQVRASLDRTMQQWEQAQESFSVDVQRLPEPMEELACLQAQRELNAITLDEARRSNEMLTKLQSTVREKRKQVKDIHHKLVYLKQRLQDHAAVRASKRKADCLAGKEHLPQLEATLARFKPLAQQRELSRRKMQLYTCQIQDSVAPSAEAGADLATPLKLVFRGGHRLRLCKLTSQASSSRGFSEPAVFIRFEPNFDRRIECADDPACASQNNQLQIQKDWKVLIANCWLRAIYNGASYEGSEQGSIIVPLSKVAAVVRLLDISLLHADSGARI